MHNRRLAVVLFGDNIQIARTRHISTKKLKLSLTFNSDGLLNSLLKIKYFTISQITYRLKFQKFDD